MQVKKQQLELDMEQQTGSKLGKEYVKAVYCHPAYLTSMQSTSCEMPGWMKHKLESRFPGEISVQFSRSVVSDSATSWTAARQASLSLTNSQSLLKPMSIESEMPSNYLILCCPLLKIAGRSINNLKHADNTTLVAESEEELKSLLMKVKEESEKVGLILNVHKTKIMATGPITSWQINGETMETVTGSFVGGGGLQNHCRW